MRITKLLLCGALALVSSHAMATIVDGVRQKPTYETTGFVTGQEMYLYNIGAGQFFTEGNAWGTQASVGNSGLLVRITGTEDNYVLYDYSITRSGWYQTFFDSETQLYVDRNQQSNYLFAVENNGSTFRLYTSSKNPTYGDYYGASLYVGLPKGGNTTALDPFISADEGYVDWAFVSQANYESFSSALEVYDAAQKLKARIDLIKGVGGDASSLEAIYMDESSTMAQIERAIEESRMIYVQAAINNASDKENVDVTLALLNPDFEESHEYEINTTGWTTEYTSDGQHDYVNVRTGGTNSNICYEAYQAATFDIYQQVEDMPVGVYEIEVQGFYRYQLGNNAGWNSYQAQQVEYVKPQGVPVYVYMNNNATPFANIYSEPVNVGTLYQSSSYGRAYTDPNNQYWYPNEMYNSAIAFESGMYKRSAFGLIAKEGDVLRIGVKGSTSQSNGSWCIWDNFKLRYRGFKAEVVQPALEAAMEDCDIYKDLLMGKTEFAALTKAYEDANSAITAQDGEAMFAALNDFYDIKESVIASKDLFLEREVAADLTSLQEAIASVTNEKMSSATRAAATTLAAAIAGNTKYEGSEIDQLKSDVSNAKNSLSNSVALYADLNNAIASLTNVANAKALGSLVSEAGQLLTAAQKGYDEGSIADADVSAQITALNEKAAAINASAAKYTSLNAAIGRLTNAIAEASADEARVAKSTLTKANLRLTASQKVYDEATVGNDDIDARVKSIDELITELTHSIELYKQFAAGLTSLKNGLATEDKMSAATRSAAQQVYDSALAAYNEGTVDDDKVEAQVTALAAQNTALQNSVKLYANLATAYPKLEAVINLKALQTLVDEANNLYTTTSTGYENGTVADADVNGVIADINAIIPQVEASAEEYAKLAAAINELKDAIALASTDEARVAKSTLTKANLRLNASQKLYDEGTIEDKDIDARVETIGQLIDELTHSILLYQQFAAGLESLEEALATEDKMSAATRSVAQQVYDTALAAYNEGTVDDDKIEAQVAALNAQITALQNSVALYADLAEAYPKLEAVINLKALQTLVDEANNLYTTTSTGYAEGTIADTDVNGVIADINAIIPQVEASAEEYAKLAAAINNLKDAIALASTDEARVAKSTRTKASLRLTASQELYDNGTIADADIAARVTSINQVVDELTHSILLYQQFAEALGTLNDAIKQAGKVSAATLAAAQNVYDTAFAAYEAGDIEDAQVESQIAALNAQVTALANSASLYGQMAAALSTYNGAVADAEGKVADDMLANAKAMQTAAQEGYDQAAIADAAVNEEIQKLQNAGKNLKAADGLQSQADEAAALLAALKTTLPAIGTDVQLAKADVESCYITEAEKSAITVRLNEIAATQGTLSGSTDGWTTRLDSDNAALTAATGALDTDHTAALTAAGSDLAALLESLNEATDETEEMTSYLAVEPAKSIAESSNIVELKAEYGTFCSGLDLDFTEVEGLKAYIVSAYEPAEGKVIMTRVYNVPAGTGLIVRGTPEGRYEIPAGDGTTVLSNLLVGTTRSKNLPVEENGKTNCILSEGTFGLGFYPTSGGILPAGKAYLPLPSSAFVGDNGVKGFTLVFDDATAISDVKAAGEEDIWYTVGGQMLQQKPSVPGIYVRNGKKVLVK